MICGETFGSQRFPHDSLRGKEQKLEYMKAVAVMQPGVVRVVDDVPIPEYGDYEMLVKVHVCGLCTGTDFNIINGFMTKDDRFMGYPTVLGHEGCGEVVAVGSKVRNYRIGDRVIHSNLRPNVGNGYTKTYGGMAQYGLINDDAAMLEDGYQKEDLPFPLQGRVPRDFDYVDGGVLLSMCESHSAAINLGVTAGQDVLIYGAGPMGQMLAKFMKLRNVASITMIDHNDDRLQHAQKVTGVDWGINSKTTDADAALKGRLFDIVVDAVGSSGVILQGSQYLRSGGKVASIGVLKEHDRTINLRDLKNNTSLHMLNYPVGEYDIMAKTVKMIRAGIVNPKDYYSHVLPYTEIQQALELVRTRKALKVILTID